MRQLSRVVLSGGFESRGDRQILLRNLTQELLYDLPGGESLDARFVLQENAVLQHRNRDGGDIFESGVDSTVHEGSRLRCCGEREGRAGAGAELDRP